MQPQRDTRGKPSLNAARPPAAEDTWDPTTGRTIVDVPPAARYGPWDLDAVEALTPPAPPKPKPIKLAAANKATRQRLKLTQIALAMRAQGETVSDIAARLAVSPATVTGWFTTHRREVQLEEIDTLLDQVAVPLATENLVHGLLAGDKDYTLETLKGRGVLKRHTAGDPVPTTAIPELRIVFEAPAGSPQPGTLPPPQPGAMSVGQVIGTFAQPKQIEGRVLRSTPGEATDGDDTDTAAGTPIQGQPRTPRATGPGGDDQP